MSSWIRSSVRPRRTLALEERLHALDVGGGKDGGCGRSRGSSGGEGAAEGVVSMTPAAVKIEVGEGVGPHTLGAHVEAV